MLRNRYAKAVGQMLEILGAAVAVSSAVEGKRPPRHRDLQRLGISPENFSHIRRI